MSQRKLKEIEVSAHAIERFAERILKSPEPPKFEFLPKDVMKYIESLIKEDIQTQSALIYEIGNGSYYSETYGAVYEIKNHNVVTVKIKGLRVENEAEPKT